MGQRAPERGGVRGSLGGDLRLGLLGEVKKKEGGRKKEGKVEKGVGDKGWEGRGSQQRQEEGIGTGLTLGREVRRKGSINKQE